MITTHNMGLTAWDLGIDHYDHSQLASNFIAIDTHDHTSGKGKQIPGAGIALGQIGTTHLIDNAITGAKITDGAITQAKLANNSVGSAQIIDGSITGADILDGTITNVELDASVNPIGTVKMWYRVSSGVAVPSGWEIMDGRAWNTITNAMGPGGSSWTSGNIPDFRNRFPLGAALSGTGSGVAQPPDFGQTGGSMTLNLTHSHSVAGHTHTVDAHTHSIAAQAPHRHLFKTNVYDSNNNIIGQTFTDTRQRGSAVPSAVGKRQTLYVPDLNRFESQGEDVAAPMANEVYTDGSGNILGSQPTHDHGAVTGSATSNTGSSTSSTDAQLGAAIDHRNAYVGVLFLMRVI